MASDEAALAALTRASSPPRWCGGRRSGRCRSPIRPSPSCGSSRRSRCQVGADVGAVLLAHETFLRTNVDQAIAALTADGTIEAILEGAKFPADAVKRYAVQRTRGRGAEGGPDRNGDISSAGGRDRPHHQALWPHAGARRRELRRRARRRVRAARAQRRRQDHAAAHPLHDPAARRRHRAHRRRRRCQASARARRISASCSRSRASTTA